MKKIILSFFLLVSFAEAANNSQATFADIKEAVYKLIIQNNTNKNKTKELDSKFDNLNSTISKKDADFLENYIDKYVMSNEKTIQNIKQK